MSQGNINVKVVTVHLHAVMIIINIGAIHAPTIQINVTSANTACD